MDSFGGVKANSCYESIFEDAALTWFLLRRGFGEQVGDLGYSMGHHRAPSTPSKTPTHLSTKSEINVGVSYLIYLEDVGMSHILKMNEQEAIRTLAAKGFSLRRIAREFGVHRRTVARYAGEVVSKCACTPSRTPTH